MYDNIKYKLHREMDRMDERYQPENKELSDGDLEVIDKAAHALKCLATYEAMEEAERGKSETGYSERRGRDAMGRYTSREGGSRDMEGSRSERYWQPPYYGRY